MIEGGASAARVRKTLQVQVLFGAPTRVASFATLFSHLSQAPERGSRSQRAESNGPVRGTRLVWFEGDEESTSRERTIPADQGDTGLPGDTNLFPST